MRRQLLYRSPQRPFPWVAALLTTVCLLCSGCVVYEPVPAYVPSPSTFDRAWNAAIGAAQDEGVRIIFEDRSHGVIRGNRDALDVSINVWKQADGKVRVEINTKGPQGSDAELANRLSRAYDRRMGR